MPNEDFPLQYDDSGRPVWGHPQQIIMATVVPEPPHELAAQPPRRRRWKLPLALFLATCLSTFLIGGGVYAACLMTILVCHEAGHFLQARRYGVYASYPVFLPMPLPPIGTFGAVIAMDSRIRDRKALFDIGISGPLAGLVPTMLCCILGIMFDATVDVRKPVEFSFGEPLLFKGLAYLRFGAIPEGYEIYLGPVAMAGWVGLLVTALNLIPIGQLDGGHILYALIRRRAHVVATVLLSLALVSVVVGFLVAKPSNWSLMALLLVVMGAKHPPTADDYVPLGRLRIILGWLTLAFLLIGFTPNPFHIETLT